MGEDGEEESSGDVFYRLGEEEMNDDLTALFLLYKQKRNLTFTAMGSWLGYSGKTMHKKLKDGVENWKLADILTVAENLQIPIAAIREKIRYERGNK